MKSSKNTTFSTLQGLKLPKEESSPSSSSNFLFSNCLVPTNETVYQVQDDSYGPGIAKWKGPIIEIGGKIFPNGKGCFYDEKNEKIEKKMQSLKIGNNFYTGELKDGKQHGWGTYIYKNGDIYKGQWINGKRKGQGKYTWKNGASYEGQWKDGKKHGQGTYFEKDISISVKGASYIGKWENDMKNGQGKMIYPDGTSYEGRFENGTASDEKPKKLISTHGNRLLKMMKLMSVTSILKGSGQF